MEPRRLSYLIAALFFLTIAAYNLLAYTSTQSIQSTFNLQPNLVYYLTSTRNPSDLITGQFQENSGRPVSFYIQSSAQFAAFQAGTSFASLYSIVNVPSGSISYTFSVQDTYYLLFRHGAGLVNTTETVFFQRTYQIHDASHLGLGIAFLAIAAVDLYVGFRPRKTHPTVVPPSPSPEMGPAPTPPSTS